MPPLTARRTPPGSALTEHKHRFNRDTAKAVRKHDTEMREYLKTLAIVELEDMSGYYTASKSDSTNKRDANKPRPGFESPTTSKDAMNEAVRSVAFLCASYHANTPVHLNTLSLPLGTSRGRSGTTAARTTPFCGRR